MSRFFVLLLIVFCMNAFGQGSVDGFYKGKGNAEFVPGGGVEPADKYFAGKNKIDLSRTIYYVNMFAGAGLSENFDMYFSLPYVMIGNIKSIQDGKVYIKQRVWGRGAGGGNVSVSIAAGFSGPMTKYETEGLNAIGQRAKIIDARPVVHYFSNSGWFGTVQMGYNYKFEPVPDAYNGSIKAGRAMAKYYFDVWYEHQTTPEGFDYRGTPAASTFRELGVGYNKAGATFYTPLAEWLGFFAGTSYVINGRNIGQGISGNVGFVVKCVCKQ